MQLKNARILLTGASGGLGHELASQLSRPALRSCSPDATSAGSTKSARRCRKKQRSLSPT
jgi:NAD(P)-dependent dehydrogenase (short-subunit alcohol dehydrogenase family)